MTKGHLLVATREHKVKVADLAAGEGREMGKYAFCLYQKGLVENAIVAVWRKSKDSWDC